MNHLTKCGYDEYGNWMTYSWFITVMKEILPHYKNPNYSPSIMFSEATWENAINTMLNLLDKMDKNNYDVMDEEKYRKMIKAKNEFFELFSKYFYYLWN